MMNIADDQRQELWQLVRLWLFDYYFCPDRYPLVEAKRYGFSVAVFHALGHWKSWLQRKPQFEGVALRAHYKPGLRDEDRGFHAKLRIRPDGPEHALTDYILFKDSGGGKEPICAIESEYGETTEEHRKDFPKLLSLSCPLKVMIYGAPNPKKVSVDISLPQMKEAFEQMIRDFRGVSTASENWLFIGMPWWTPWPECREDATFAVHTLTTPCESVVLEKPSWDVWAPAEEMDAWLHEAYTSGIFS